MKAFCLFGTGKELNFGRSKRESIRNGIYEIAAKFKGTVGSIFSSDRQQGWTKRLWFRDMTNQAKE